ncbi:MAG: CDP-archaeol synthase [Clostridia bacterium]|nr:CDP-archaeol synthase [Clostridia bacterium]
MKKRVITAIVYVAILVSFYALKLFVSDYCFDGLVWLFAVIGTYEMARACSLTKVQKLLTIGFAAVNVPLFVAMDLWKQQGYFVMIGSMVAMCIIVVTSMIFDYQNTSLEQVGKAVLTLIYPNLFLNFLVVINHMNHEGLLVMFPFAITPITDVFAFTFGSKLHKKFPKKLAPEISPNKTIVGGIGGIIGGVCASALLFFIWKFLFDSSLTYEKDLVAFLVMGFLIAVVTQMGDLVESAVKRKAGIKDMGNCLPGHGGVLDRIDSSLYACLVTFIVFVLISAI